MPLLARNLLIDLATEMDWTVIPEGPSRFQDKAPYMYFFHLMKNDITVNVYCAHGKVWMSEELIEEWTSPNGKTHHEISAGPELNVDLTHPESIMNIQEYLRNVCLTKS